MDTSVLVAIITGICSVIAVIITNSKSNREMLTKIEQQEAVFETSVNLKIDALKTQVEKHNSIVERTYILEKEAELSKFKIDDLNKRMHELEKE